MRAVLGALEAEQEDLDSVLAGLDEQSWDLPTPAEPWTIRDQVAHLAFFDEKATLSAQDPDAFVHELGDERAVQAVVAGHASWAWTSPAELLARWRSSRRAFRDAISEVAPDARVPWYGPPMRARTAVAARLMETWAHGTDVCDGLGIARTATDRLFHVADLGVRTYAFSFRNRGLEPPPDRVRVALRGPGGMVRVWNDDATASVTGPVDEFCLVVAQRRHVDDTHLFVEGTSARRWMELAQVFAGPPGPGRTPAARPVGP